jgi:hypothetical protein
MNAFLTTAPGNHDGEIYLVSEHEVLTDVADILAETGVRP